MGSVTYLTPSRGKGVQPPGDGGGMEARVAKLESDVEYIKRDIADIKSDVKEIRKDLKETLTEVSTAKIWAVMLYVAGFGAMLLVMAKGFKWI